jgi:hypothetical protein
MECSGLTKEGLNSLFDDAVSIVINPTKEKKPGSWSGGWINWSRCKIL